jgi:hypothetical protein
MDLERNGSSAVVPSRAVFGDGYKQINAQPDPNPALHRVHGSSIKQLDPQVLLDPLEKKLHLPALFVGQSILISWTLPGVNATCVEIEPRRSISGCRFNSRLRFAQSGPIIIQKSAIATVQ